MVIKYSTAGALLELTVPAGVEEIGVSTFFSTFVGPTQQDNVIFLSSPDASHPYPSMTADQAS